MPEFRTPIRLFLLLAVWAILAVPRAGAQEHRLVPPDHWAYEYIHRLQLRGHLLELHPTALPYTTGEIASAVDRLNRRRLRAMERRWADALQRTFRNSRRTVIGAEIQPGVDVSSATRLDPLRPAGDAGSTLELGSVSLYPHAAGRVFLESGPAVVQAGLRFDMYYRDDPDGLDAANRLITRNEDAYAGIGTRYVSAYAGRVRRHWAPHGRPALLVSDNSVGFDQIFLRVGGDRLSLRSLVGELDSMTGDGRFTGTAGADSVETNIRRFVSAHRIDWRPSRKLAITVMESTLYSSPSSGFSLKFLNPLVLHAFAVDGRPKNDENNGLLAGMLWAHVGRWTLQGQMLIDDIDLMGSTGEPPAVALSGSLVYAGLADAELGTALTAVAARAYNAHQPDGRYTHLLRGIGAPFNDYVHASLFTTFYLGDGALDVALTPRLDALYQGTGRIHMPFPASADEVDFILDGIVERVIRPGLEVRFQGGRSWWARVDAGPAFITNENHVESSDRTLFTVTASLVARLAVADRLRISF